MKRSFNAQEVAMLTGYIKCGLEANEAIHESAKSALLVASDEERERLLADIARCEATGYTLHSVLGFIEGILRQ